MRRKLCFIGLGSIATRHLKNLIKLFADDLTIDVLRIDNKQNIDHKVLQYINNLYFEYDNLPRDYDVIFITNPTALHYETLKRVKNHAKAFFIEKPVFSNENEDIEQLKLDLSKVYYVACPLRYMNVIQYIRKNIDTTKVYSARIISSSYLPEWRLGIDYRNTYSAKKELGGGVSVDLIHEWDYICYLFGIPRKINSLICKKSKLEINSDDVAVYIAEYTDKCLELHLDYFGRFPIRKIELFMDNDTLEVDLIKQNVKFMKEDRIIEMHESRDEYQIKELSHFFDIVDGKCSNDNTLIRACQTLKIVRGKSKFE